MASREEIEKRYEQFRCYELPGQPMMAHMGTSYLVNDLHNALTAADEDRDRLREALEVIAKRMDGAGWLARRALQEAVDE